MGPQLANIRQAANDGLYSKSRSLSSALQAISHRQCQIEGQSNRIAEQPAIYKEHKNILGNKMRWRKSTLSELPSQGLLSVAGKKIWKAACRASILQGSGSVELLAGSVSLGAEMNYLRPWRVPPGTSPPAALFPLAAFSLSSKQTLNKFSKNIA